MHDRFCINQCLRNEIGITELMVIEPEGYIYMTNLCCDDFIKLKKILIISLSV